MVRPQCQTKGGGSGLNTHTHTHTCTHTHAHTHSTSPSCSGVLCGGLTSTNDCEGTVCSLSSNCMTSSPNSPPIISSLDLR